MRRVTPLLLLQTGKRCHEARPGVVHRRLREARVGLAEHDWPSDYRIAAHQAFTDAILPLAAGRYAEELLTAIRRLELVAARIADHTGDNVIAAALARFREDAPDAKGLRDVHKHLDEYAAGQGHHARTGARGHWWPRIGHDHGHTFATIGELHVNLDAAAEAAVDLARTTEVAWRDHRIKLGRRSTACE